MKYFYLVENGITEHYLILANSFDKNINPRQLSLDNYESRSIIYKFINDNFIPIQTIPLYDVLQFLPVMVSGMW